MFRFYDIRGLYREEIDEGLACFLAEKFYFYLKRRKINLEILTSIDIRDSSLSLLNSFSNYYLRFPKTKIQYLGILPSPMFYYYCIKSKKAGVIITASHLPIKFNGFKFILPDGQIWVYKKNFKKTKVPEIKIKFKKIYLDSVYLDYVKEILKFSKLKNIHSLSVSKNKSPFYYSLSKFAEISKNIKIINAASLKITSDFDGDRLFIKYKNKELIPEQILFSILKLGIYKKVGIPINIHKKILEQFPDVKFFFIPTGHTNFKKAFKKYNLDFAMEPSFHFYFFKELKTEAPLLGLIRFLEYLEKEGIENLLQNKYYVKRLKIRKNVKIDKVINVFKKEGFKAKKFDGFYIYKSKIGAFHIRKSNTEKDTFRIFIESEDEKGLKFIDKKLIEIIKWHK